VKAEDYELETAEDIRDNLIADHTADEPDVDPIGEMEQGIKEDAYTIQADIIRDVCSYDRDDSSEWESHLFTDAAAHMCRRNEYAEQSPDRDDDEIVVKQATYLDELDRRVLSGLSLDLELPDVEFG
jgi:hypothetical protein